MAPAEPTANAAGLSGWRLHGAAVVSPALHQRAEALKDLCARTVTGGGKFLQSLREWSILRPAAGKLGGETEGDWASTETELCEEHGEGGEDGGGRPHRQVDREEERLRGEVRCGEEGAVQSQVPVRLGGDGHPAVGRGGEGPG